MEIQLNDLLQLSIPERIQLVEDLWDSIAADPSALPLTQGQKDELDDRLIEYHADPTAGRSWEDVRSALTDNV